MNVAKCCLLILSALAPIHSALAQDDFAPGQLAREQLPKSRALDYEFDEVRIATILGWLRRVSVEPPVALSGTVSGWLWAQAPSSGWWRIGDYRVEGEVHSPLLGVDRLSIRQARVRFGYRQGLWTIGTAGGSIETLEDNQPTRNLGQARLSAVLPTNTRSNATVEGELTSVSLVNLLQTLGISDNLPQGQARATFRIQSPLVNLSNPLTWQAGGRIAVSQLQFGTLSDVSVESDWNLRDETLALAGTRVGLPGRDAQALALNGSLQLRERFNWQVQLPTQPVSLNSSLYERLLPAQLPQTNLPVGNLQLNASASGTLSPWAAQYAIQISDGEITWLRNALSSVNAQLSLTAAGLAIDSLSLRTAGGALAGNARFTSQIDEPVRVQMNYRQIDLAALRAPIELPTLAGTVSGQLNMAIDKRRMNDLVAIQADLRGSGQGVQIADWGLGNITYSLDKAADQADIAVHIEDAGQMRRWLADCVIAPQAAEGWQYKVDARGNALDLSVPQLIRLIGTEPQLLVPLETLLVTGNITLHGDTSDGVSTTEFNFSNITTLQRDRRVWSQGSMKGRTTPKYVEIEQSQWKVGGSDLAASLKWHYLRPDQPLNDGNPPTDQDHLRLQASQLKLESLQAWRILVLPTSRDGRRPLNGLLSANVDVQRPAGAASWLTNWQGNVNLQLDNLKLHENAAGHVALAGELATDRWHGQVSGELLSAPVEGSVTVRLQQQPALSVQSASGKLTWVGAEVGQLLSLWQDRRQSAQWRGIANLRTQFDWDPNGKRSGTFELDMSQLAYRQRVIVRSLQAIAALENDRVTLVRFDGGLGGGRIDLGGGYDFGSRTFDEVTLQLQRVSLEEVAQLVDPDMDQEIRGRADVRARLRINQLLDVHGDIRLHDVNWAGFPIDELHSGFELTSSENWSIVRVRSSNARGRIMGGRSFVDLQARLGQRNSIDLRMRVDRGEVDQLSKWTGTSSVVGKGKFDAVVNVSSYDARSLQDLQGVLDLSFEDTNARTLPVADQLARFVPLFALPSTEFESGKLSATISRGDLRMRSLALWGRQLSVLGSGNVGMASGRLDLQLVVRTGGGLSQQVAANYLTQLAASSVPPVELVLQINRLVANRAIFLRIAGTTAKPVIQPQAARIIEQALLRSLLEQAVGITPAIPLSAAKR